MLNSHVHFEFHDEQRYITLADHLINGYYASTDTLELPCGPGYPLFLAGFRIFGMPVIVARLANACLLFAAVCLMYTSLKIYLSEKKTLLITLAFGLYAPFWPETSALLSENLAIFLIVAFCFFWIRWFKTANSRWGIAAGVFLGLIALTKVLFAYTIIILFIIGIILFRWRQWARRVVFITIVSLLVCLPYLIYTWKLTGKVFYWANTGGSNLYWMTNPYPNQYGNWCGWSTVFQREELAAHRPLARQIENLNWVEKDALLKQKAKQNILQHPGKCMANWFCAWGRMFFNYPYTGKIQNPRSLLYMFFNSFVLVLLFYIFYNLIRLRHSLEPEWPVLVIFTFVSLIGMSMLAVEVRHSFPFIPLFVLLGGYLYSHEINMNEF